MCTHNINKTLFFYLKQERFIKMNRKTANPCLTDMINISIESFKWLLNEINKNKTSLIYPLSVKMHFSLKVRVTRRWRIVTILQYYFCWGFTASFIVCIWTQFNSSAAPTPRCGTLNTIEPLFTVLIDMVSCCFHQRGNLFSSKYKDKEKPKTGLRPGPGLNYGIYWPEAWP